MVSIRMATPKDVDGMLSIYQPLIVSSATSFEFEVPTHAAFNRRVAQIQEKYPWLVCEWDKKIAGYAYAGSHRSRDAYQWSVELSVYVNAQFQRKGIARALYESLIALLKLQGFVNAFIGITLPNEPSTKFHESLGFQPIGTYHNVGYKKGQWHSVGWWELPLSVWSNSPKVPLSLLEAGNLEGWQDAFQTGLKFIKGN